MSLNRLVELDAVTLDSIRQLIRPIVQNVAARYFDDSTTYANEMASEIEDEISDSIQAVGTREGKLSTFVGGDSIHRAGQIKELLKDVSDDRLVLSQIVGSQSGVYNAYFELGILNQGKGPVVMSAGHPQLAHLSMCASDEERQQKITQMIADLNALR